jgi:hypothetical protein
MLSRMTEWMTLFGVIIAAGVAAVVQLVINRGEPSALKRIRLLNEAINGISGDEEAKAALIGVRSALIAPSAKSLLGAEGFARWLRVAAWLALGFGVGGLALTAAGLAASGPDSAWSPVWIQAFQLAFILVFFAPILLLYSAIWPGLTADARAIRARIADKSTARGYRKIREALTVEEPIGTMAPVGAPAAGTGS